MRVARQTSQGQACLEEGPFGKRDIRRDVPKKEEYHEFGNAFDKGDLSLEDFDPGKIVSLWDIMTTIDLGKVLENLTTLRGMVIVDRPMPLYLPVQEYQILKDRIDFVCSAMETLGLPVLSKKARKLRQIIYVQAEEADIKKMPKEMLEQFPVSRLWMLFRYAVQNSWRSLAIDLKKGFPEELSSRIVMVLPVDKTTYFLHTEEIFSDIVRNSFSSATYEMDEASRCFALGRNTACVFHLMRIMETGLNAVGSPFGVSVTNNWHSTLKDIENAIKERNIRQTPDWRAEEPFYAEAVTHFRMVKDAWRNHTMHINKRYDEERAKDILNSVAAFMRHLATRLHE
jgi:hypothetical protein